MDVLHHDIPVRVLPLSGRPERRGHWSSDLNVFRERRRRVGHEILPLAVHRSIVFVEETKRIGVRPAIFAILSLWP